MRFLLLFALFLHTGPAEGTQGADELGTPNINTIIEWVRQEYPNLPRIQTTNCRPIAGSSTWSQHSWANAADIFVDKQTGDELYERLRATFGEHIKTILWQVRDHHDHIHLDTWPTGIGTPPCAGGSTRVRHKDGSTGTQFTDDIEEVEVKIPKPNWLPDSTLEYLVLNGIIGSIPTSETLDMWRTYVMLFRIHSAIEGGASLKYGTLVRLDKP